MTTPDEIERRVEEVDSARTARRSAAATEVGELAKRHAAIAEQLADVDRQLGDVLAGARDVMDIDEFAKVTDVPAADLTRWLEARKTSRTKRTRPTASTQSDTSRGPSAARTPARSSAKTPTAGQASPPPEPAVPRADAAEAPARVTAEVS